MSDEEEEWPDGSGGGEYRFKPKPTIADLERILSGAEGEFEIEIKPNGEVITRRKGGEPCIGIDGPALNKLRGETTYY